MQQEWTRNQLVNYFQIQHSKIYTNALRGFQGLVQAHAAAQTITDIDGLKVQLQELREIPYEAYASLQKHQGITTEYIAELISLVRANIAQHESAGMTRAEAEAQPSNFLPGLSLGELLTLQGAAEERRDSAADTTEGKAKGITKGQSVEYGAFNITRADGSILIAYVAGRADVNDILEDLIEAHIKHTVATTGLTYTQLGNTIKEIEKHLPPVTMPDGKVEKLTLLPAGKTEYTQQNIIEAYSKLALANYLYNEQYLPLTQGGHRLLREIGRVVDTTRLYKAIGDAWFTYANSEQGKANLANGGQTFADLLTNAGFKIGTLVANARANAEQTLKVIEGRDFQPDPAQEVKALINRAEAEQQLADLNAKQAQEPITIPASESITGKEITIEPESSEQETLVSLEPDPAANLRNLIAQGKATEKDFAEFFTKHPITHAAAIEQGLVPVTQDGQPSAAYIKGRQEAQASSTPSMSIIGPSARTWNNYTDRVFYGLYDGMPRVELDSSKFKYRTAKQRGLHITEDDFRDRANDVMLFAIRNAYKQEKKTTDKKIDYIQSILDFQANGAYVDKVELKKYLESHPSFDESNVGDFIFSQKPYSIGINLSKTWTLGQVLDAPELYAAYPHLKDILVHFTTIKEEKVIAQAWGSSIDIDDKKTHNISDKKANLLHEIQHLIQDYEGFANGTSSRDAYEEFLANYERARADVKAANLVEASRNRNIIQGEALKEFSLDQQLILKRYLALKKINDEFGYNPSILARFIDFIKGREKHPLNAHKFYFISAGEAESRAVARRADLTEQERKDKPFNESLDVDVDEAVVVFKNYYFSEHGTSVPTTPTAAFSIKAAQPAADRFKASPLGHNMLYFIRNEARRYARIFGDKSPHEQAVNAAQSAAAIIAGVDKYLQRTGTESKPVPQGIRRRLQHLQKVAEKYAQIIATGRTRSFKKLAPQEQAELQAAIADLQQQEQEAAITDADKLLTDSDRLTKKERTARQKEHDRTILREAAKGRVYATLAAMLEAAADALDTHLKNEILVDINRITAPVKIKRTASGRLKGKMTAPIYRKLEQAIQFMALSPRALETAIDDIFAAQETLARAIIEGDNNLTSGNTLLIQLADQLSQGGIKVTPQTLTAALTDYSSALFQLIQF